MASALMNISASYKPNSHTRPFPKPSSQRDEGIKLDAGASEDRCRNEMNAGTKLKPARMKRNSKELAAAMT